MDYAVRRRCGYADLRRDSGVSPAAQPKPDDPAFSLFLYLGSSLWGHFRCTFHLSRFESHSMPSEKVLGVGAWEMTTKVGLGAVASGRQSSYRLAGRSQEGRA